MPIRFREGKELSKAKTGEAMGPLDGQLQGGAELHQRLL